ncbi:MAG: hypothetical protein JST91_28180 [Actinobacteria bacterium]|nr:hypothetical protein [Actinomycetota bacterium]
MNVIKGIDDGGQEFWSARDLMKAVEYDNWQNFEKAIIRARTSADNIGAGHGAFTDVSERVPAGIGYTTRNDVLLTRFGAYLVVMNGDPRS